MLHDGQFYTLEGLPGGVTGINERGELAGSYPDTSGTWHGFIATPQGNRIP